MPGITKGIILAGGKATRLYPMTLGVSKQLLPVYDKPLIYYPLSVLMLAGIKDILIITTAEALDSFKRLLSDGSDLGINISYKVQTEPRGLADAFIVGEEFIGNSSVALILGDNIFYGQQLPLYLQEAIEGQQATIFAYYVQDPQRYGIVEFDRQKKVLCIEEKPDHPKSNWAVTGLYFYDNQVIKIAKDLKPSERGEIEITDINNYYLKQNNLKVETLGRGYAWLDTGTYDSLMDASLFIKTIEARQGLKIGCIEEVAFRKGYITKEQVLSLADKYKTSYGEYLKNICQGDDNAFFI